MSQNTTNTTKSDLVSTILNAASTFATDVGQNLTTSTIQAPVELSDSTNSTTPIINDTTTVITSTTAEPNGGVNPSVILISCVLFLVAVALILKIVLSNRKKRSDLIGGSARWRLAASQQSGSGPARTAASYVPMSNRERPAGGLDSTGPGGNSVDWERQFFDDTEPTIPSRLQLQYSRE